MKRQDSERRSYPIFDWLRFVLASGVTLSHNQIITWQPAGGLAVNVFFALSGWLIGGILIEGEPKALPRFYFNRVTRIWLPYFATVAALYSLSAVRDPITAQWFKFLVYDVTFTHNWFSLWPDAARALAQMPQKGTGNHFWSIAVEEQFYLIAPAVIYSNRFGRSPFTWIAIFLCLLGAGHADFAAISAGVASACAQKKWPDWHTASWSFLFLLVAILPAILLMRDPVTYDYAAPFFSIAVVLLAARPGRRGTLGTFLGGVSYPMYLNAWIGAFAGNAILKRVFPDFLPYAAYINYVASVGVAILAYIAIDRNVMARRNAWYSPSVGIRAAAVAYLLFVSGMIFGVTVMLKGG